MGIAIAIARGNDRRFTYCPVAALPMLKPQYLPGEFDTEEQALDAARSDSTIPHGSTFVVVGYFTPRLTKTEQRLTMLLSPEDYAKIGRGGPWAAEVTDLTTGQRWKARGAACSAPGCFCDAIVRPL